MLQINNNSVINFSSLYKNIINITKPHGSAAFDTLQAPIPHITVYYICIHKLITFVTLLHLITPQ